MNHVFLAILHQERKPENSCDPENYDSSIPIELYRVQFSLEEPQIGQTIAVDGILWSIRRRSHFSTMGGPEHPTREAWVLDCTIEGDVPEKTDWLSPEPPILYALAGWCGETTDGEGGFEYGIAPAPAGVPNAGYTSFYTGEWEVVTQQEFLPTSDRPPGGFGRFVLCWCNPAESADLAA